jgi:hypothetical protein
VADRGPFPYFCPLFEIEKIKHGRQKQRFAHSVGFYLKPEHPFAS